MTSNYISSEKEESHFIMSYIPHNRLKRTGRRRNSAVDDIGVGWEFKYKRKHFKYDSTSLIQCSVVNGYRYIGTALNVSAIIWEVKIYYN